MTGGNFLQDEQSMLQKRRGEKRRGEKRREEKRREEKRREEKRREREEKRREKRRGRGEEEGEQRKRRGRGGSVGKDVMQSSSPAHDLMCQQHSAHLWVFVLAFINNRLKRERHTEKKRKYKII